MQVLQRVLNFVKVILNSNLRKGNLMNENILNLIIKQRRQCRTPEILAAIEEQERLSEIMHVKREEFDKYNDQSFELLQVGTEKFFNTFPEYKSGFSGGETKIDIVNNCINIAMTNPQMFSEIQSKMNEIEELRKNNEITPKLTKAFYEYLVAFSDFEEQLKKDREVLFASEYRDKMADYADKGVLLYYLETPDLPILDSEVTIEDVLESLLFNDCFGMRILFSPLMQMDNPGISMKRKQEDIGITIELIACGHYRSAVRNLFALLDSEHKKAANTYEGIIKRKQEYKKGIQRSKKISKLVESLDDSWMDIAWEKVNSYYANVVSTNPVEGVIHRNSIVHGDYDSQLIDVDKYAATKLMLLYLNLRIIADYFSNKAEILENLLLYLPSIILYIQHHPDSKGEE